MVIQNVIVINLMPFTQNNVFHILLSFKIQYLIE